MEYFSSFWFSALVPFQCWVNSIFFSSTSRNNTDFFLSKSHPPPREILLFPNQPNVYIFRSATQLKQGHPFALTLKILRFLHPLGSKLAIPNQASVNAFICYASALSLAVLFFFF